MKKGIDISYYQGNVDFILVKKDGIEFVIIREGYRNTTDKRFFEYVKKAREAGLVILSVYHFSYALNDEESRQEARLCVENMKKAGLGPEVLVFFDFEYDSVKKAATKGVTLKSPECNAHTLAFCEEVKKLGYIPGIYTNLDYYKNWYSKDLLDKYPIWLADYSGGPDFECLIQQYTSKGRVSGIKGDVDLNYYYDEEFKIGEENPVSKKDNDILAQEVIAGKWGSGDTRRIALTTAGYDYKAVQALVNQILNGSATISKNPVQVQDQSISKKVTATGKAHKFDNGLVGTYTTTENLYCRDDSGTNKKALCLIPKGTKVKCYGYYNLINNIRWLYIQFVMDGIQYTGFSSIRYLKK